MKLSKGAKLNQATAKRYEDLNTCLSLPVVHQQKAAYLSTDSFSLSFRGSNFQKKDCRGNDIRQSDKFHKDLH